MRAIRGIRRLGALAAVLGLLLLAATPDATPEVRTDPGDIAGFRLRATAAPITVRIFEPTIPIPADPGVPNLEVSPGYSSAQLGAGPVSRAVASLVWPGPGVGDGFGNFAEEFGMDPESEYPLRMAARYPSGPFESEETTPTGGGMRAQALGLDVEAVTEFGGELLPLLVDAGTVRSHATATVTDGVGRAVADSALSQLSLLEGLITIDEVRTRLVATTDGVDATVRGATDVVGLTVAGVRYAVDRDGVRIEDEDEDSPFAGVPSLPLRLLGIVDLRDLVGVRVSVGQITDLDEDDEIAVAGRRSEGVTVTLELGFLFELLNALPLEVVVDLLPDDVASQLLLLLGLSSTVEIAIGFADVEVSATEAFTFDPPAPPPLDGFDGGFDDAPPVDLGDPSDLGLAPPADFGAGPPQVAPPSEPPAVAMPISPARQVPDRIPLAAQLLVLAGVLVAGGAWLLERLSGAVFAAPAAAATCRLGGDSGVPDLRSWTAT